MIPNVRYLEYSRITGPPQQLVVGLQVVVQHVEQVKGRQLAAVSAAK